MRRRQSGRSLQDRSTSSNHPKSDIRNPTSVSRPCAFTNAYYTIENYVSNSRLAGCVMVSLRTPYMRYFQPAISLACVFVLIVPPAGAQTASASGSERPGFFTKITDPYRRHAVAPVNLSNSSRLEALLRAGRLYLSLQDTIALALENNLDIELQRYGAQIADASILRAKAGGLLRGVTAALTQGPTGAPTQAGQATGLTTSASTQTGANTGSGTVISQTGTTIPNLDPVITGFLRAGHASNPQTSTFVT